MSERLRIVIAEDEKNMRDYLGELLPRLGHQVVVATTAGSSSSCAASPGQTW